MTAPTSRRLIVHMSASLDGFVAHRDGTIDWLQPPGEPFAACGAARHAANLELLGQVGQIVLGRGAYDQMAEAWSRSDNPMARLMNSLPKLVFTSSEPRFEWSNSRHSARPVEEEIPALKAEAGADVVCFGGARLVSSLAGNGLIDEYRLTVHPVVLGDGLPLWHGLSDPQRFTTVSATTFADGSVTHHLTAGA
jgi:dihydrofolate reductase